ncbi:triose/dihydroxyacetone kinase DHA [Acrasis kona]|uniref:Triose/dihydroxyacetone kinase DHA n=1 Tax=Acrasis kona TaxID=1008807 RepID=A0AAW2Z9S1_9EUKA
MTKKLLNEVEDSVREMIRGVTSVHSHLKQLSISDGNQQSSVDVIVRADLNLIKDERVTLISGGGSGHEPSHGMYVGKGMLTAAVCGAVFTSPAIKVILQTIRACCGSKGCLLIVKNYTGDRLNFGAAMEQARLEGFNVELVIVGDDCSLITQRKRRGIAGTVFVHKIVGAYAEKHNLTLSQVKQMAQWVANSVSTMGVALSGCNVPGNTSSSFNLPDDQVELGLGIHGEQGVERVPIQTSNKITKILIDRILQDEFNSFNKSKIVLLINNLGSTTALEQYVVARDSVLHLKERGYTVERVYVGTFMSAMDMSGVSISILNVDSKDCPLNHGDIIQLLDAESESPNWPPATSIIGDEDRTGDGYNILVHHQSQTNQNQTEEYKDDQTQVQFARLVIEKILRTVVEQEPHLTKLDTLVGDGDMGFSFKRGASLSLERLSKVEKFDNLSQLVLVVALAIQEMGGSSGAIMSAGLINMSHALKEYKEKSSYNLWSEAFIKGVEAMNKLGGASKGDRTMMDALYPLSEAISSESVDKIRLAAEQGANNTKDMVPGEGRSGLIGASKVKGHVDPGAFAVSIMTDVWADLMSH